MYDAPSTADPAAWYHFLLRDDFGTAFAETYGIPDAHRFDLDRLPTGSDVRCLIAVYSGHDPALREALDDASFSHGVASFGIELLPTRIVCGPVVIPGQSACYGCYLRRIAQHGTTEQSTDPVASTRGIDEGFTAAHLGIAHGFLRRSLHEVLHGTTDVGGTVRSFDLTTGTVSRAPTIAVDRCDRCGRRFDRAADLGALSALA